MKILILNVNDSGSGAAIAAYRLSKALISNGINVTFGVQNKNLNDDWIVQVPPKKKSSLKKVGLKLIHYIKKVYQLLFHIPEFQTSNTIFHSTNFESSCDINWINNFDCDLIHLHWINGMISNKDISKIKKPIIWTLHDSWPFCGAEHHPNILENDIRFIEGYSRQNKPVTTKGPDLCKKVWKQKNKYLRNLSITFISPSNWEKSLINKSKIFSEKECYVIPNIIPSNVFFKKNINELKTKLSIPNNKKILGFGAAYGLDDPKSLKGCYYLIQAIKELPDKDDYFLIIFGTEENELLQTLPIKHLCVGYISNPDYLAQIYSCCDCFAYPSLIENLPTVCIEASLCQTPVVAFNVCGIPDTVEHKITGYLATPYESSDLVTGIEYCITHHDELSKNCLIKSKRDFNENDIIKKHIQVYESVLKHSK